MKPDPQQSRPALAKGQLWRTQQCHIQIVDLGKMLVHYKMLRAAQQRRRTQTSRRDTMEGYLKTNGAQLVESRPVAA